MHHMSFLPMDMTVAVNSAKYYHCRRKDAMAIVLRQY